MKKPYSLCIGIDQIKRLKKGEIKCISHSATQLWRNAMLKGVKVVKFFHRQYSDEIVCEVTHITIYDSLNEKYIKIHIK